MAGYKWLWRFTWALMTEEWLALPGSIIKRFKGGVFEDISVTFELGMQNDFLSQTLVVIVDTTEAVASQEQTRS